jgi:hypothetical protein
MAPDAARLLAWVLQHVPARLVVDEASLVREAAHVIPVRTKPASAPRPTSSVATAFEPAGTELAYEIVDWKPAEDGRLTEALYEPYGLQSVRIEGARPHPTRLVQSAAMASVAPPKPTYQPRLLAKVVSDGLRPMPSSKASSMPARRTAAISPDRGWSMRPSMSSRPRPMAPRTLSASGAAGCWATVRAPARAAK